jgi:hypothetical protein
MEEPFRFASKAITSETQSIQNLSTTARTDQTVLYVNIQKPLNAIDTLLVDLTDLNYRVISPL